jgi:hypothetical protein
MKLAVVIPAHCHPDILRMTLGSLLRTFTSHDLDIHVGFHFNYRDYCPDTSIFQDLRGVANVHLVDEIDWRQHGVLRYSVMHASHLIFLLKQIRYCDFDHVLLLDDDVLIHQDFVSELLVEGTLPDLIGTLFDDSRTARAGERGDGACFFCLPKISPWHLLLSKRLYQHILANPVLVQPRFIRPGFPSYEALASRYALPLTNGTSDERPLILLDTFAGVLQHCLFESDDMHVRIIPTHTFKAWATHFFFSSFNYGRIAMPDSARQIQCAYKREFPNGIADIFSAYRTAKGH